MTKYLIQPIAQKNGIFFNFITCLNTFKQIAIVLFFTFLESHAYCQILIKPGDRDIAYMGRVKIGADSSSLYWPGSSAALNFKGTGVSVILRSLKEVAYFYAIIDKDENRAVKIKSDSLVENKGLFSNLAYGNHTIQLFQLSNNTAETVFYGFKLEGSGQPLKPGPPLVKKIEFYGNSITAGHGVDAMVEDKNQGAPVFFNNYYTYAALTARHYNAQYFCIARSGIGIMVSWFPQIMPEMYDLLNPLDPSAKWDFSAYTPDVVVINLFQNDSWLVKLPDHEQFKNRFGTTPPTDDFIVKAYEHFIKSIRTKYPNASIICALGSMDATQKGSKWPAYITQAVKNLNDAKMYTLFFPFKNTPGHPKRNEQQAMANDLIAFIDKNIKW